MSEKNVHQAATEAAIQEGIKAEVKITLELGMWVLLCHFGCHEGPGSVHDDAELARQFRKDAQRAAMLRYSWSREEFIRRFGKNSAKSRAKKRNFADFHIKGEPGQNQGAGAGQA